MSRLRNRLTLGALGPGLLGLAVAGSVVGCVPAEQYAGMKMKADQLSEQLAKSQGDIDRANARADAAERQVNAVNNGNAAQTALLTNEQQRNEELQRQADEAKRREADALALAGRASSMQALPTTLNDELKDFASKNAETIEFDPAHGVVKFKSDVVFGAGETALSAGAKRVLATFATILNSGGASGYDLLVAGHTDSTPVINKVTIQHGNFDNWYLSAHRAIAVGHELITDGVQPSRLGTIGYADQRPAAPNTTPENMAKNRRVEVLIVPASAKHATSPGSTRTPKRVAKTTAARGDAGGAVPVGSSMNKDGGGTAPAPAPKPVTDMNK